MLHLQKRIRQVIKQRAFSVSKSQLPNSFTAVSESVSHDLSTQIRIYKHNGSGAYIYNLVNKDSDNCFAPVVKTLPKNNTGCPHILEHLACCGSEKYPIRDPFFNMLKRSTNTYMNAWTGQDFTAYPFSSANQKDFTNLYQVYLDLCLKPNLNELDFRQEGWRYEYNSNSEKQIKGIVFNEMKGAYQSPQRQMYVQINNKLFAGTPYQYDSGGKPEQIVKLSYAQIRQMHKYYYHPSNTSFFYYGNQDISEKLKYLESEYLHKYSNQQNKYKIASKENSGSNSNELYHQFQSQTAQSLSLAIAYNLGELEKLSQVQKYFLQILTYIMSQANPILHEEFIESDFADSIGASGFQPSTYCTFKVILKNVKGIDSNQNPSTTFYNKFQQILNKICISDGTGCYKIDENRLQQFIVQNQINLLTPKQTNGIQLLGNSLPYMNNRLSLTNMIDIRSNIKKAVEIMKNPISRKQYINKFFFQNQNKVVIKQIPKKITTQDSVAKIIGLQMPEELIRKQQDQLKIRQQNNQANSKQCLPSLNLTDLQSLAIKDYKVLKTFKVKQNHFENHRQIHVPIPNQNVHFFRFVYHLPISEQANIEAILPILDLWKYTIIKGIGLSTTNLTNKQLLSKLKSCCSHFDITIQRDTRQQSLDKNIKGINVVFSATCLTDTISQFLTIYKQIMSQSIFKQEDCRNSFRGYLTDSIEHIGNMPMRECMDLCSSLVINDQTLNNYYWIIEGIKAADKGQVTEQFKSVFNILSKQSELTIIEHSSKSTNDIVSKLGIQSSKASQKKSQGKSSLNSETKSENMIAVTHNYDVNFCTQQYPGPAKLSKSHANLSLFLQILEQDYLHPKIRQQGGAYGARTQIRQVGTIALYSYMDPYAENTFKAFDQSIQELISNSITEQAINQVKIKLIGQLDRPIPPQDQCVNLIVQEISVEEKQKYRKYIENASIQEIMDSGKQYLIKNSHLKKKVVFGKQVPTGFKNQKLKIPERSSDGQAVSAQ